MDERDFPSSSDESDADFVPKDEEDNSDTGSEVSDYEACEGEKGIRKGWKRKKNNKKCDKKAKINENEEEKDKDDNIVKEEKKEIDVDALWADFKKDVNSLEMKKTVETCNPGSTAEFIHNKSSPSSVQITSTTTKHKGGVKFSTRNKVGGLTNILNQIGKKDKMSTLQKSQLDWNNFKKSEGIEEEIKTHNRGKDGYLDKQDFLQRTDLRQFEIEKDLRSARRKF